VASSVASVVRSGAGAFHYDSELPPRGSLRIIVRQLGQGSCPQLLVQFGELTGDHRAPGRAGRGRQVAEQGRQPRRGLEEHDAPLLRRRTGQESGALGALPGKEAEKEVAIGGHAGG